MYKHFINAIDYKDTLSKLKVPNPIQYKQQDKTTQNVFNISLSQCDITHLSQCHPTHTIRNQINHRLLTPRYNLLFVIKYLK